MNRERIETGTVIGREASNTTDSRGIMLLSGTDNFAYVLVNRDCQLNSGDKVVFFAPSFINKKLDPFRGIDLRSAYNDAISIDSEVCRKCPFGGSRALASVKCPSYEKGLGEKK